MLTLLHMPLCPFSRFVRLVLGETGLAASLVRLHPWEDDGFLALNPAGTVPVLIVDEKVAIPDSTAIAEYLEELNGETPLLPGDALARAEARRLVRWFSDCLHADVTAPLLFEKFLRREKRLGGPDMGTIRAARAHLVQHLRYVGRLASQRHFLAGERLSLADLAAAAQLSTLDYLGDVSWDGHDAVRDWYARVKSRPSFRPLLADQIGGIDPPAHYTDLDF
ncbi:MAG: glutathione S-transferase family protein [Alphaproteobacteria bacterium]|nr:glutathione S-transferase family protein [Alphaproteobacteria bacterium]